MAGRRGYGSPYTHQMWGVDVSEYVTHKANDEVIVCVQIESQEGVDNMEEIAQTEGIGECCDLKMFTYCCSGNLIFIFYSLLLLFVCRLIFCLFLDVLFIGPYDLSLALGYPTPNPEPHPDVETVIQRIKDTAHKYRKKV